MCNDFEILSYPGNFYASAVSFTVKEWILFGWSTARSKKKKKSHSLKYSSLVPQLIVRDFCTAFLIRGEKREKIVE